MDDDLRARAREILGGAVTCDYETCMDGDPDNCACVERVYSVLRAAVAAERKRCAKIADAASERHNKTAIELWRKPGEGRARAASDACDEIAAAIRGDTKP